MQLKDYQGLFAYLFPKKMWVGFLLKFWLLFQQETENFHLCKPFEPLYTRPYLYTKSGPVDLK